MKKFFMGTVLLTSILLCGCSNNSAETPSGTVTDTSAATTVPTTAAISETTKITALTEAEQENLSDYDAAIKTAAEYVDEKGFKFDKFFLYDLDYDGIPELIEEQPFMDTIGWEIYKLTSGEAVNIGCMEFAETIERFNDSKHYHGDELTLESGVHIYRDTENDEVFYVTEYITELHTTGKAVGMRYDIYADKLAERELYHCDFLTWDDCGESGNRYITHNILDGTQASPMYRCDCNSEGFLYCNEFGGYLSNFEYLGMIETENYYTKENGGSFYDYAETVNIPEGTREEQFYTDERERVTVCGKEYYADTYEAEVTFNSDNFDSIDLSELKLLPNLEKLALWNLSDKTVDISEIADIESLTEVIFYGGGFDYSPIVGMDNVIYTNAPDEYALKMKSIRVVDTIPKTDDIDGYAPLYDLEQLEVVMYSHYGHGRGAVMDLQTERLAERRPDLLLIYVP